MRGANILSEAMGLLRAVAFLVPAASLCAGEGTFARLEEAAAGVRTVQSDFVQEKHLSVFREVITSKGRFAFEKPDRLRWEILEPVRTGFVITAKEGRRWNERTGRTESFDLDRDPTMRAVIGQILAWARADFTALRREYRIRVLAEEPADLRLEPMDPKADPFLDYLRISFVADGRHVKVVEVHERGGDWTRIVFARTVLNEPLPPGTF